MHGLRAAWRRLRETLGRIPATDRYLVLFMAVLLGQSAYSLFFGGENLAGAREIDVIVRTASAAIFGYFLSARGRPDHRQGEGGGFLTAAAAAVGLFCLLTLLLLRNRPPEDLAVVRSDSATATVAQFRDFVSGCVGFLIGLPSQGGQPPTDN